MVSELWFCCLAQIMRAWGGRGQQRGARTFWEATGVMPAKCPRALATGKQDETRDDDMDIDKRQRHFIL